MPANPLIHTTPGPLGGEPGPEPKRKSIFRFLNPFASSTGHIKTTSSGGIQHIRGTTPSSSLSYRFKNRPTPSSPIPIGVSQSHELKVLARGTGTRTEAPSLALNLELDSTVGGSPFRVWMNESHSPNPDEGGAIDNSLGRNTSTATGSLTNIHTIPGLPSRSYDEVTSRATARYWGDHGRDSDDTLNRATAMASLASAIKISEKMEREGRGISMAPIVTGEEDTVRPGPGGPGHGSGSRFGSWRNSLPRSGSSGNSLFGLGLPRSSRQKFKPSKVFAQPGNHDTSSRMATSDAVSGIRPSESGTSNATASGTGKNSLGRRISRRLGLDSIFGASASNVRKKDNNEKKTLTRWELVVDPALNEGIKASTTASGSGSGGTLRVGEKKALPPIRGLRGIFPGKASGSGSGLKSQEDVVVSTSTVSILKGKSTSTIRDAHLHNAQAHVQDNYQDRHSSSGAIPKLSQSGSISFGTAPVASSRGKRTRAGSISRGPGGGIGGILRPSTFLPPPPQPRTSSLVDANAHAATATVVQPEAAREVEINLAPHPQGPLVLSPARAEVDSDAAATKSTLHPLRDSLAHRPKILGLAPPPNPFSPPKIPLPARPIPIASRSSTSLNSLLHRPVMETDDDPTPRASRGGGGGRPARYSMITQPSGLLPLPLLARDDMSILDSSEVGAGARFGDVAAAAAALSETGSMGMASSSSLHLPEDMLPSPTSTPPPTAIQPQADDPISPTVKVKERQAVADEERAKLQARRDQSLSELKDAFERMKGMTRIGALSTSNIGSRQTSEGEGTLRLSQITALSISSGSDSDSAREGDLGSSSVESGDQGNGIDDSQGGTARRSTFLSGPLDMQRIDDGLKTVFDESAKSANLGLELQRAEVETSLYDLFSPKAHSSASHSSSTGPGPRTSKSMDDIAEAAEAGAGSAGASAWSLSQTHSGRSWHTAHEDQLPRPDSVPEPKGRGNLAHSRSKSTNALKTLTTSKNLLEEVEKYQGEGWWSGAATAATGAGAVAGHAHGRMRSQEVEGVRTRRGDAEEERKLEILERLAKSSTLPHRAKFPEVEVPRIPPMVQKHRMSRARPASLIELRQRALTPTLGRRSVQGLPVSREGRDSSGSFGWRPATVQPRQRAYFHGPRMSLVGESTWTHRSPTPTPNSGASIPQGRSRGVSTSPRRRALTRRASSIVGHASDWDRARDDATPTRSTGAGIQGTSAGASADTRSLMLGGVGTDRSVSPFTTRKVSAEIARRASFITRSGNTSPRKHQQKHRQGSPSHRRNCDSPTPAPNISLIPRHSISSGTETESEAGSISISRRPTDSTTTTATTTTTIDRDNDNDICLSVGSCISSSLDLETHAETAAAAAVIPGHSGKRPSATSAALLELRHRHVVEVDALLTALTDTKSESRDLKAEMMMLHKLLKEGMEEREELRAMVKSLSVQVSGSTGAQRGSVGLGLRAPIPELERFHHTRDHGHGHARKPSSSSTYPTPTISSEDDEGEYEISHTHKISLNPSVQATIVPLSMYGAASASGTGFRQVSGMSGTTEGSNILDADGEASEVEVFDSSWTLRLKEADERHLLDLAV